jgi:fructose transport system permease protein
MSSTTIDPAERFIRRQSPIQRLHTILHRYPAISPVIVLVLACLLFSYLNPRFYRPANLSLIAQQVAVVGGLAIGQTLIILTAGIDLSVGAVMVFSAIIMAGSVVNYGVPGILALVVGLIVGTLAGTLNGLLVTRLRLPPFIVTLGTLNIFTAMTLLYSNGATVQEQNIPAILLWPGTTFEVGGFSITTGVIMMLVMYVAVAWILRNTAWGKHIYAVGDDSEATRLAGIETDRLLISGYAVCGLILGLTAWIMIGRVGAASPNAAADSNLDSITAVVIGGTSLFGGRGTVFGSLIGALIVGVFRNGLALAGVDVLWQTFVVGVLVIVAVAIDQWIRRVRA